VISSSLASSRPHSTTTRPSPNSDGLVCSTRSPAEYVSGRTSITCTCGSRARAAASTPLMAAPPTGLQDRRPGAVARPTTADRLQGLHSRTPAHAVTCRHGTAGHRPALTATDGH
jgi:hypothetical protein